MIHLPAISASHFLIVVCVYVLVMFSERDWKDVYPFHCAAQLGDASSLKAQLATGGVQLDAADDDGWAALHYAAWYGHVDAVGVLLAAGADVNVRNGAQATPLHFAAGAGRVAVVRALLQAGADRTLRSNEKQTPAELAKQLQPDEHQQIINMLQDGL